MAVQQQIIAVANAVQTSQAATSYGTLTCGTNPTTTEANQPCVWPAAGTLSNLSISLSAAPGGVASWAFTVRVNGVDTTLSITITGASTAGSDTTHTIAINAGDTVVLKEVPSGTPATSTVTSVVQFNSTNAGESGHAVSPTLLGNISSPAATAYTDPFSGMAWNATETARRSVIAAAGTITALYIKLNTTPGAGGASFYLYKNGVKQDGTGVTANTLVSLSSVTSSGSTTFSLAVVAGDEISVQGTGGATFLTASAISIRFLATTDGQSNLGGMTSSATNATSTVYLPITGSPLAWSATESTEQVPGGLSSMTLSGMQVALNFSPGAAKQYVFNLRQNAASPGPSVTISGASTSGSDLVNSATILSSDKIDVQAIPSGTPATGQASWAFIQTTPVAITVTQWQPSYPASALRAPLTGFGSDLSAPLITPTIAPVPLLGWAPSAPAIIHRLPIPWLFVNPKAEVAVYGGTLKLTQQALEDLEQVIPALRITQDAVDDLEQLVYPPIRITQYVMEILFPFTCDVGLPPVPPPPSPPVIAQACVAGLQVVATPATAACVDFAPVATSYNPPTVVLQTGVVTPAGQATTLLVTVTLDPNAGATTTTVSAGGSTMTIPTPPSGVQTAIQTPVPKTAGTYQVTVTVVDSTGNVGSAVTSVTVSPPPPVVLQSLKVAGPSPLTVGQQGLYTATATYSNSATKVVSTLATWTSSNTAVATVTASGAVTALAAGTATITASYSEGNVTVTANQSLTVNAVVVNPPAAASSPSPANTATGVSNTPTLTWTATGASSYLIAVGTSNPPGGPVSINTATYQPGTLLYNTVYYWQVTTVGPGGSTVGPVWSFTTVNTPPPPAPGAPSGPSPVTGAIGISTTPTLTWTASSGATSYQVNFGTSVTPPQVVASQLGVSYTPANLLQSTTYYWQITAVNAGGSTAGPVWSFTTVVPTGGGNVVDVFPGDDLQAKIDAAQGGDSLVLHSRGQLGVADFTGNYILRPKPGVTRPITLISAGTLPAAGARIDPSNAGNLTRIQAPAGGQPAFYAPITSGHYHLVGLEILPNPGGFGDIVMLGDGDGSAGQTTLASVPTDFVIDRCYIHGDPALGQKRGISLNCANATVTGCYISDIKAVGQDNQALCGWNGPGPFTITNNYLEAAGENVLFGGADASIPNLVPSDILFSGNVCTKQVAWRTQNWQVKNLFELKNAQRVTITNNTFSYCWVAAQSGYAILFTPRNQGGTNPWSVVQQVTFSGNTVSHVSSAFQILGVDDTNPSQLTNNILIRNNKLTDISSANWGGDGRFALLEGGSNVTLDHNTAIQDGATYVFVNTVMANFVFTNNIVQDKLYGLLGDNRGVGNDSINFYFPGVIFTNNVIEGATATDYPAGNFFPATDAAVGFSATYALLPTSPYLTSATDGTAVGSSLP